MEKEDKELAKEKSIITEVINKLKDKENNLRLEEICSKFLG